MFIFLHFHKAGGTSLMKAFKNKYRLYPYNRNGNPWTKDYKKLIMYWKFKPTELNIFLENCQKRCDVIALEWNYFKNMPIKQNIKYITILRDPLSRFISCYTAHGGDKIYGTIENFRNKFLNINNIRNNKKKYMNKPFNITINKDNFYIRMLNGLGGNRKMKMNKHHLEIAKQVLDNFEIVMILENQQTFKQLDKYNLKLPHSNKSNSRPNISSNFRELFKRDNELDYQLYSYAVKLAKNKI